MNFMYHTREGDGRQVLLVTDDIPQNGGMFECNHFPDPDFKYGEGASIVIPRDRVPDLIAALQRFMEETK